MIHHPKDPRADSSHRIPVSNEERNLSGVVRSQTVFDKDDSRSISTNCLCGSALELP